MPSGATPPDASAAGLAPDNTQTIARNSFWFTLELIFSLLGAFITSVIVARVIGPARLGDFSLIVWLTNVTTTLGAFGLPMTTRKYMAEYINRGNYGVARSIYHVALRLQFWIAALVTLLALVVLLAFGNPQLRLVSVLLSLNMAPRMIGFIPSQANNAAEAMRRNTGPTVLGAIVGVVFTLFALWMGWDLPGIAAASVAGAYLETGLKLHSVRSWLGATVREKLPPELRKQMFVYSGQGLALLLLNIVVWDRSDLIFLKLLNSDIRQVTFFSIAFNLTERVLIIPNAFAYAVGATMMAQYGRGEEKVHQLTVESARYAFLLGLPLLAGLACVSAPAVMLLYRAPFRPMIPVLAVVAVMAIAKSLMAAPTSLLQTTENQGFLVLSGWICGGINVLLDILLTPRFGALGAAFANGSAQAICCAVLWIHVYRLFHLNLRLKAFGRILLCGLGMAAAAILAGRAVPGYAGLAASILAAVLAWFLLLRWLRVLDDADRQRLLTAGRAIPERFRLTWTALVGLLAPDRV